MQEISKAEQEGGAPGCTVEEIQARMEACLRAGVGRTHCRCGEPIDPTLIGMYPHSEGIAMKGMGRQWVYIRCPRCGYDWALWKLRMRLDTAREAVL
jgi:hypothetical protein